MKGLKIGKVFGIDIEIHPSWFIIFGLVVWLFAGNYLPETVPGQSLASYWIFGFVTAVVFFFSVLFHELAHSLMGRRFKIIIRRITLFIFGGVAQMENGAESPKAEFFMAAAGPASSLFLAGIFLGLMQIGGNVFPALALAGFYWLAFLNAMLAVFNLIPGFPLDGGRVFRAILWHFFKNELKATKIASYGGRVSGIIFILGGVFLFVFSGDFFSLIWLGFIGLFLFMVAKQSYQQLVIQKILGRTKVKEIMEREIPAEPGVINPEMACSPEDDLKTVYERMTRLPRKSALYFIEFDVVENGGIVGRINIQAITNFLGRYK